MAEKTYKNLGPARKAFDEAIKAAVADYEEVGGVTKVEKITLKRNGGQIHEVRINH